MLKTPLHDLRVADVAVDPAPIVPARLTLGAARKIATLKSSRAVLVEDGGRLIGFVELSRVAGLADGDPVTAAIRSIARCLTPMTSLRRAHELCVKYELALVPVAAGPVLFGLVSRSAIEGALFRARAPRAYTERAAA